MDLAPGTRVRCVMTKWGDRPHWEYDAVYLGTDEHGDWLGLTAGTPYTRPGMDVTIDHDHVGLVPAPVDGQRPWHLAVFHAGEGDPWPSLDHSAVAVYVDMTTPAEWDGTTLRAVDLDLDVVKGWNGRVMVDDEDEFAEHQVELGYPPGVVAATRASCEAVTAAVRAAEAPYDGTHRRWLDALAALGRRD